MIKSLIFAFLAVGAAGDESGWLETPPEAQGKAENWIEDWRQQIKLYLDQLTVAYDLDEAMQQMLKEEMNVRWREQIQFEQKLDDIVTLPPEQVIEALKQFSEAQPLNRERVADWLEETLLPDEQAKRGRVRLRELWYLQEQRQGVGEEDATRRSSQKKAILHARLRDASLSPDGRPMPFEATRSAAPEAVLTTRVRPRRGVFEREPDQSNASDPLPAAIPSNGSAPAFRDWAEYLGREVRDAKLSESDCRYLQARVMALQARAQAYLSDHPGLHAELTALTSHELYQSRLREMNLDGFFDALFEELRQDVERIKAGGGGVAAASGAGRRAAGGQGTN